MFFYNWHQLDHVVVAVEGAPHPTRRIHFEWAIVLDALQLMLLADVTCVPTHTTATSYCVMEFAQTEQQRVFCVGCCVEQHKNADISITYFIMPGALDPELVVPDGKPLTRHELRHMVRSMPEARTYRQPEEYQAELLRLFGGLSRRFFAVLTHAITFTSPIDTRQFVLQWLLEERPLRVSALQRITEPFVQLSANARQVEDKLTALQMIVSVQEKLIATRQQHHEMVVVVAQLRYAAQNYHHTMLEDRLATLHEELAEQTAERDAIRVQLAKTRPALFEAELALRQTNPMRRHDDIQRNINQATHDANMIQSRWITLQHDVSQAAAALRPLLDTPPPTMPSRAHTTSSQQCVIPPPPSSLATLLTDKERNTIKTFLRLVMMLSTNKPPDETFVTLLDATVKVTDDAFIRAIEQRAQELLRLREVQEAGAVLHKQFKKLRQGYRGYPTDIERVCDLLTTLLGDRPPLLCEVIEVPDERWQNVVEAMLNSHRFTLLVPTEHVARAQQLLNHVHKQEHIYGLILLDVARLLHEKHTALPGSLAEKVEPHFPALRPYIYALLGNIIACNTTDELAHHHYAITADGVVHQAHAFRTLSPDGYRPWFIGKRSLHNKIVDCRYELIDIKGNNAAITQRIRILKTDIALLQQGRKLALLRSRFDVPLDDRPLRAHITTYITQQKSLDMSDIEEQQQQVEALRQQVENADQRTLELDELIAANEREIALLEQLLVPSDWQLHQAEEQKENARYRYPHAVAPAEKAIATLMPTPSPTQPDIQQLLSETCARLEQQEETLRQQYTQHMYQFIQHATAYTTRYMLTANVDNPDDQRFVEEQHYLQTHELPLYQDQIETAKRTALDSICQHVLLALRERIITVQKQLDRFNEALSRLDMYGSRYRFCYHVVPEQQHYYNLIMAANTATENVLDSALYRQHQHVFDELYELFTASDAVDNTLHMQAQLLDYRSYFSYDIEVITADGNITLISNQQTVPIDSYVPFYVVIAATFAQLYQLGSSEPQETLRLVAFQDVFSTIEQDSFGAILDIFKRLGLQVVIPETMSLSARVSLGMHTHHLPTNSHPDSQSQQ